MIDSKGRRKLTEGDLWKSEMMEDENGSKI